MSVSISTPPSLGDGDYTPFDPTLLINYYKGNVGLISSPIVYNNEIHYLVYNGNNKKYDYAFNGSSWGECSELTTATSADERFIQGIISSPEDNTLYGVYVYPSSSSSSNFRIYRFNGNQWEIYSTGTSSESSIDGTCNGRNIYILNGTIFFILQKNSTSISLKGFNISSKNMAGSTLTVTTPPFCTVIYNNEIYFLGSKYSTTYSKTFYNFSTMTTLSNLPWQFYTTNSYGAVVFNNRIYIFGSSQNDYIDKIAYWDGTSWTVSNMTIPFATIGSIKVNPVVWNNKIYLLDFVSKDLYCWDGDENSEWEKAGSMYYIKES